MTTLTIGITNCNRLLYTKALLKSLEEVASYDDVQLIVVDNASAEPGTEEALKSVDYIDELYLRKDRDWLNDEYTAKNIIITKAKGDIILFLQDDCQLIVPPEMLMAVVDDFVKAEKTKCVSVTARSRKAIEGKFVLDQDPIISSFSSIKYWFCKTDHFQTIGLFKKKLFDEIGLYPDAWPIEGTEFDPTKIPPPSGHTPAWWGKSEDYYDCAVRRKFPEYYSLITHVPLFANIWNDPRGYYAIIRGNKRCGHYLPPSDESGLYYRVLEMKEVNELNNRKLPPHFAQACTGLGWSYPVNDWGDQVKYSQKSVIEEGPHVTLYEDDENSMKAGLPLAPFSVGYAAPEKQNDAILREGPRFIKPVDA